MAPLMQRTGQARGEAGASAPPNETTHPDPSSAADE